MKRKSFAPPLQILKKKINNSYPAHVAGFFFCLASAEGAGLFFLPGGVSATHKRLQLLFCYRCKNYTAPTPKASTGLYSSVSVDLTHSRAHNTAATQAAYAPPAPRWRAYRQALRVHRYQIQPTRRTLYRAGQPPIIIRYIRVRHVMDTCQAVQYIADHASGGGAVHPACILYRVSQAAGSAWHAPPGGTVQRRAARNH